MSRSLRPLVEVYIRHLTARGYAARTLSDTASTLGRLVSFLAARKITQASDVTPEALVAYQQALLTEPTSRGRPAALGTQVYLVGRVRSFFRYLARSGMLLMDPSVHLELPRVVPRLPARVLTQADVRRLLVAPAVRTDRGLRDRAILELFYSTGIRVSELIGLDVHDIDFAAGELTVRRGKAGRGRRIPVGTAAVVWVRRYLEESRPRLARLTRELALFVSYRSRRMTRRDVSELVRRYAKRAGIALTVTPHALRHTFATHMLAGRASLRHLQQMLGHVKLTTTQVYTRVDLSDLKEVHRRCHPRGRG